MIISASRRTDIPAFYGEWFMRRIRAGFCEVINPYNPNQKSTISLKPEDVDCIIFWTRYPASLFSHLDELSDRGYFFYFLFTIVDYPKSLDKNTPPLKKRIDMSKSISEKWGKRTLIWRYDPIIMSNIADVSFHLDRFSTIAEQLSGYTSRVVVSFLDLYSKAKRNIAELNHKGIQLASENEINALLPQLVPALAAKARLCGMKIQSCAEELDLTSRGIGSGACIDPEYLKEHFGIAAASKKDPGQRNKCKCVQSRDIGAYNTCRFGCVYCYATADLQRARLKHKSHDPNALSL